MQEVEHVLLCVVMQKHEEGGADVQALDEKEVVRGLEFQSVHGRASARLTDDELHALSRFRPYGDTDTILESSERLNVVLSAHTRASSLDRTPRFVRTRASMM
jgi:hypothetical protein